MGDFVDVPGVYPAGRLDYDSEGLLILTDDGRMQARISQPRSKLPKTYLAQVEGTADEAQLDALRHSVKLRDGPATALAARRVAEPVWLWSRNPPVRFRKSVPDSWIELSIDEGRNRQLRRMTAAVGLPTLRLIRLTVGSFALDGLQPGEWRQLSNDAAWKRIQSSARPAPEP